MSKKSYIYVVVSIVTLFFLFGCNSKRSNKAGGLFGATGKPLDMIVLLPDNYDSKELRDSVSKAFGEPVDILPQNEPIVTTMFTAHSNFNSMFKTMRNVLYVSIDPDMYTKPTISVSRDEYISGQLFIHAKAESLDSFYRLLKERGRYLSDMIYQEEIARTVPSYESTYSSKIAKEVENTIPGWTINVSNNIAYSNIQQDFIWASDMGQPGRSDLIIYSFPYEGPESFSVENLIAQRDKVLQMYVKGQYENSHMTTEKRVTPKVNKIQYKGRERIELRGLWAMVGDMMGGPFVMHAMLDNDGKRVVVAEASVYNPAGKKRNMMLYSESALYTFRPAGTDFNTHQLVEK